MVIFPTFCAIFRHFSTIFCLLTVSKSALNHRNISSIQICPYGNCYHAQFIVRATFFSSVITLYIGNCLVVAVLHGVVLAQRQLLILEVHREYFELKADGKAKLVSAVPPDAFSSTGQIWGNPVYDWDGIAGNDFEWWKERVSIASRMFNVIRVFSSTSQD